MWELGIIFGLSFVPVYLSRMSSAEDARIWFKKICFYFNILWIVSIVWVAKLIAGINDATVEKMVNYMFLGLASFIAFIVVVSLLSEIYEAFTKEEL